VATRSRMTVWWIPDRVEGLIVLSNVTVLLDWGRGMLVWERGGDRQESGGSRLD
jgi:hypothetical protein